MRLKISGFDKTLMRTAIAFYMKYLNISKKDISVLLIVGDDVMEETGRCYPSTDNSQFMITIKEEKRNLSEVYLTLAHEMVHIKQFLYQDLQGYRKSRSKDIAYRELWYEKEAYALEGEMLIAFVTFMKATMAR